MSKDSASKKPTADPVKPSGAGEKKPQVIENKDNGAAANAQKPKTQQQQPQKKQTTEKVNDSKDSAKPGSEKPKDGIAKVSSPPQQVKDVKPEAKVGVQTSPVKDDNSAARSPVKVGNKEFVRQVVVERGVSGTVSWFSNLKGFGFIDRKDKDERVFVHCTAIIHTNPLYYGLDEGEEVEFDIVNGPKGLEAAALTAPGGYVAGFRLRARPLGLRGQMRANFSRPQNGRAQNGRPQNGRAQNGRGRRDTENTKDEKSESVSESESESGSSEDSSATDKSEEKKVVAGQRREVPKNSGDGKQLPPKQQQQQQKKPEPKAVQGAQKQDVKAGQGAQKQTAKK